MSHYQHVENSNYGLILFLFLISFLPWSPFPILLKLLFNSLISNVDLHVSFFRCPYTLPSKSSHSEVYHSIWMLPRPAWFSLVFVYVLLECRNLGIIFSVKLQSRISYWYLFTRVAFRYVFPPRLLHVRTCIICSRIQILFTISSFTMQYWIHFSLFIIHP